MRKKIKVPNDSSSPSGSAHSKTDIPWTMGFLKSEQCLVWSSLETRAQKAQPGEAKGAKENAATIAVELFFFKVLCDCFLFKFGEDFCKYVAKHSRKEIWGPCSASFYALPTAQQMQLNVLEIVIANVRTPRLVAALKEPVVKNST